MNSIQFAIGFLCITVIITVALVMGHNGVLAGAGASAIVGVLTWQARKVADKRGGNVDAMSAALRKAGFNDQSVTEVASKLKGGKK